MFYIYLIRDPRSGKNQCPIYVGKGQRERARTHLCKNAGHNILLKRVIAKIRENNKEPIIEIITNFNSEIDAFNLEIKLIAKYGRRDLNLGTLCNLTNGGPGAFGFLTRAQLQKRQIWLLAKAEAEIKKIQRRKWRQIKNSKKTRASNPEWSKLASERGKRNQRILKIQKKRKRNWLRRVKWGRTAAKHVHDELDDVDRAAYHLARPG